jgi:hypothetical protein
MNLTWLTALVVLAQAADTVTTALVLRRGGREANPLMPKTLPAILVVKAGVTALAVALMVMFRDAAAIICAIATIAGAGPAIWNGYQLVRSRA